MGIQNNLPTGAPSLISKAIWAPTPVSKPFDNDNTLLGILPGNTLNLSGLSKRNIFNSIWGPGSNGIQLSPQWSSDEIEDYKGGLNYSTQPGVGWSKIINGIYTTGFSLQSSGGWHNNQWTWVNDPDTGGWKPEDGDPGFNYLTYPGLDNQITITLPSGAKAIVLNLEELTLAATNSSTPSNQIVFTPKPGARYGGFAWYEDNRQSNLEIRAQSSTPIPAGGFIQDGGFRAGSVLSIDSSSISDLDNTNRWKPTYRYKWEISSDNGMTWTEATSQDATDGDSSLKLTDADIGSRIRGVAIYLDGRGTTEIVHTASSPTVVAASGSSTTPAPTYSLTPVASSINEGDTLTTAIATANVASGTTLYYALSGTGITSSDFSSGGLTGQVSVGRNGTASFSHTLASDLTTEGSETLQIQVFSDAARTIQVGSTASVAIGDISVPVKVVEGPTYSIQALVDGSDAGEDGDGTGTYGLYRISGITGRSKAALAVSHADLEEGTSFTDTDVQRKPLVLIASNGKALPRTWIPLAIRKDGANIELLYKPTASATNYQTQDFSLSTGRAVGSATSTTANLLSFEVPFSQDLNKDGIIGPAIQVNSVIDAADLGEGNDGLGTYGLYRISGINGSTRSDLVISTADLEEGTTLPQSELTTLLSLLSSSGASLPTAWTPLAIRRDNENIELLYKPTASATTYQTQDFSISTGRAVGSATAAVSPLARFEVTYDQDLNDDGAIGVKFLDIGTTTAVPGTSARDALVATSLQVAYGGGADDQFSTAEEFEAVDPITFVGGTGNDSYNIHTGAFIVIYDLGTSKDNRDIVTGLSGTSRDWTLSAVKKVDYLLNHKTNGTSILLVDPLGRESAGNRIESLKFSSGLAMNFTSLTRGSTSILSAQSFTYETLLDQTNVGLSYAYGISEASSLPRIKSDFQTNSELIF